MRTIALLVFLAVASSWAAQVPKQKAPAPAKAAVTVYTGVVDEQAGDFMLTKADDFSPVALLFSPNFDKQIFSRFVGHPVTVKATLTTKDGKKVLVVQGIDDIKRTPEPGTTK